MGSSSPPVDGPWTSSAQPPTSSTQQPPETAEPLPEAAETSKRCNLPVPVDDKMDNPFCSLNKKAEKALAYYKETEGVDYELITILAAQPAPVGPFVVLHLNFIAMEKGNGLHGYLKLFFAEVFINGDDEIVNCCVILNARNSGMINGCFVCGDYVIHPKGVEFFRLPHVIMPGCDSGGAGSYFEDCVNCGIPRKRKPFPCCLNCGAFTGSCI